MKKTILTCDLCKSTSEDGIEVKKVSLGISENTRYARNLVTLVADVCSICLIRLRLYDHIPKPEAEPEQSKAEKLGQLLSELVAEEVEYQVENIS